MNKSLLRFFVLLVALSITACNNDDDGSSDPLSQLPPETQTGENTFGCLIDGKVFVPEYTIISPDLPPTIGASYSENNNPEGQTRFSMALSGRIESLNELIRIRIFSSEEPFIENVPYPLELDEQGVFSALYLDGDVINMGGSLIAKDYITTHRYGGTITFSKIDTSNRIVSGTFQFDCINQIEEDVVSITNGRFDIKY